MHLRLVMCSFALLIAVGLTGCATHTLNNRSLWYRVTVPKTWNPGNDAVIRSTKGDSLIISRVRDDSALEAIVRSRRKAFEIAMSGFVVESERWIKVNGFRAWKLVGTHRKGDLETVHVKVVVDAKQYKYYMEFRTPSESYRDKREVITNIIRSLMIQIPEY